MFKKKPQIKNLSPLRSSDRRRLADQIIADYQIQVPAPAPVPIPVISPQDATPANAVERSLPDQDTSTIQPTPTLTSIRVALLPENTSSARFTTTSGPNATLVSGTVYVGTHPGQDERILWYSQGKDSRLIPTVYTLWSNPNLVPLLHTADFVVDDKLKAGADLMTPGLFKPRGKVWDARATKGSIVAVAGTGNETVPVWVGQCEIDIHGLPDDLRGSKGAAVKGLHWEGDELWSWSIIGKGGLPLPDRIEGWAELMTDVGKGVNALDLQNDDEIDDLDGHQDGGVSLTRGAAKGNEVADHASKVASSQQGNHKSEEEAEEEAREPMTKEVDEAFFHAFLYSAHAAKKQNRPPHYGFDFPIQPSFLIANMVQPYLRVQNQHYNIKKTSWKNTKKFIKFLDKQSLVKSKDRNGGETVILDIDFTDEKIANFQPYKLPKPKPKVNNDPGAEGGAGGAVADGDSSLGQTLTIQSLYRASSKLVPSLLPSKTNFYTAQDISSALKAYIEANPDLSSGVSISRNIRLDPFIANNILGSNSSSSDQAALRAGEIDRGLLNRRILEDDHLCVPYHVILRNNQVWNPEETQSSSSLVPSAATTSKPKPGTAPRVQITIEKRTGTKVVTKLSGLETYNINPQLLAPELQKKCAGSASVGQLTGGRPGMMEIVIQGDQRDILTRDVLVKRGVKAQWIEVVDKSKKGKK